jgi:hypothetical protein
MQAKRKAVIDLAVKITDILAKHPNYIEAVSALVIARELLSLNNATTGVFLGSIASTADEGLHEN